MTTASRTSLGQLLSLAAPIAFGQAGIALMGLIDTAVVGRLGAGPLGAVGLANGLFFAVAVMGIGAMMGLDPLFSQAFGAGNSQRARELGLQALWLALLVTLALAVPMACLPLLMKPAGIAPDVARDASWFLWLRMPGLWPTFAFVGLRSYLSSAHIVKPLVISTILANGLNLVLDLWFVFGGLGLPALGAPGAGLATSLCALLQFAVMLWAARKLGRAEVRGANFGDLRKALRVGIPVGMQMGAEVGVFALVGVLAGRLDKGSLAAHQVAIALASFTFCAAVGVGQAGTVSVGRAVGARDTTGARRAGLLAFLCGGGIMSFSALAFWLAPGAVARLLTDRPEVMAVAVPLLSVCAVFQISDGVQAVGAGVLRGAGDTRWPFVANVVGHYFVGLPIAIWLGLHRGLGVIGLWWGLCAGLTAVAVFLLARFLWLSAREIVPLEHGVPLHG